MRKFETDCDMGSIKIFNNTMSCFFDNGIGDLPTIVFIQAKVNPKPQEINELPFNKNVTRFLGHFTVKTEAYLASYDCSDDNPLYTFSQGRWFVYLLDEAILLIEKADEDLYAWHIMKDVREKNQTKNDGGIIKWKLEKDL